MGKNNALLHSQHTHVRYRRKGSSTSTESMNKILTKQPECEISFPTSPNNQASEGKRAGNTPQQQKSNSRKRRRRKVYVPSADDNQQDESIQTELLKDTVDPCVHYSNQHDGHKSHARKKGQIRKKSLTNETRYKPINVVQNPESTGQTKKDIIDQLVTETEELCSQTTYSDRPISPPGPESAVNYEELAYTVEQRRVRKSMSAQFELQCGDAKGKPPREWPTGTSSQDTQSASDDEASFVPLMEGNQRKSEQISERGSHDFFPNTFPMEKLASCSSDAIGQISIVGFECQPNCLRVRPGHIVVLKVSSDTMGMVEHCLDVTFTARDTSQIVRASSPVLRASEFVAWRFGKVGRVDIECSVYHTKGTIEIVDHVTKDVGGMLPNRLQEIRPPVPVMSYEKGVKYHTTKTEQACLREMSVPHPATLDGLGDEENMSDTDGSTSIFHSPHHLRQALDEDVEVCREVLLQFDQINATSVIIGQVACPLAEHNMSLVSSRKCEGKASSSYDFQELFDQVARMESDSVKFESASDATAIYTFFKQRKFCMFYDDESNSVDVLCRVYDHNGGSLIGNLYGAKRCVRSVAGNSSSRLKKSVFNSLIRFCLSA